MFLFRWLVTAISEVEDAQSTFTFDRLGTARRAGGRAPVGPRTGRSVLLGAISSLIAVFGIPLAAASAAQIAPRSAAHLSRVAMVAAMPRTSTFCALAQAADSVKSTTDLQAKAHFDGRPRTPS